MPFDDRADGVLIKPGSGSNVSLTIGGKTVALSNLDKLFWPALDITKRDLLNYYARVAPLLLPHIRGKAMVMKRYPNGAGGAFFFMKRTPAGSPPWLETCRIEHDSGNVIAFPIIQDLPALLWVVNLGCIDLNPWYSQCSTPTQPEYLHFDLDPFDAPFEMVREAALIVADALRALDMQPFVKTSGGRGLHVYVAIRGGCEQHEVWNLAKQLALGLAKAHSDVLTAVYAKAKRPKNRVLVDYNQNRFGATLASIYSVRPNDFAGVSMPVSFEEIEAGIAPQQFTLRTAPERLARCGDLWKPLTQNVGRFNLRRLIGPRDG